MNQGFVPVIVYTTPLAFPGPLQGDQTFKGCLCPFIYKEANAERPYLGLSKHLHRLADLHNFNTSITMICNGFVELGEGLA